MQYQQNTNILIDYDPFKVDPLLIGNKSLSKAWNGLNNQTFLSIALSANNISKGIGILGSIPTRYYLDTLSMSSLYPMPRYYLSKGNVEDELDDRIVDSIKDVMQRIARLDTTSYPTTRRRRVSFNKLAQSILLNLTHGAIYINELKHNDSKYSWNYHIGTSSILTGSQAFPPPGERMLYQQTQLDNAILQNINDNNASITQGFRVLPQIGNQIQVFPIMSVLGVILYPFGVSFLIIVFTVELVREKELKVLILMEMNGMKKWAYNASQYVTFFTLYFVSALCFVFAGRITKLNMFTQTELSLLIFVLFIWGHVSVSLCFLFSTGFRKSQNALVYVFLIVLCSIQISISLNQIYLLSPMPDYYNIWPPIAFYRILNTFSKTSYIPTVRPYNWAQVGLIDDEVRIALIYQSCSWPIILILAWLLSELIPDTYGLNTKFSLPFKKKSRIENDTPDIDHVDITIPNQKEDEDVASERKLINSATFNDELYPLVVRDMTKTYGKKHVVKNVSFLVEKGTTFALLGPNGAGKTTLFSILTGLIESSSGQAKLGGFDLARDTQNVYKILGICPQLDIHWPELTVGEHLYFYARIKGIVHEKEKVEKSLKEVDMLDLEHQLASKLSGGQKRRLSIAISLLGNPQVVFLDEPTTGLDPVIRRQIWSIINQSRKETTIVLTTHSMEEAEALCTKIGIMSKGSLLCCGTLGRLKERYGMRCKVLCNTQTVQDVSKAQEFVKSLLPEGYRLCSSYSTSFSFDFQFVPGFLSSLFSRLHAEKSNYGITDFGINQTTLEDIFFTLIEDK